VELLSRKKSTGKKKILGGNRFFSGHGSNFVVPYCAKRRFAELAIFKGRREKEGATGRKLEYRNCGYMQNGECTARSSKSRC